jgi:hypothetical protein
LTDDNSRTSFLEVLLYPVRNFGGAIFLTGVPAVVTLTQCIGTIGRRDARIYLALLAALVTASYLYRVLESVVSGEQEPPGIAPEDWDSAWQELAHYLGGLFVAYLPVWFLLVNSIFQRDGYLAREKILWMLGGSVVAGTAYFPMALLLNGFTQRIGTAFNFGVGFRSIWKMGSDYVFCAFYFLIGNAGWVLLQIFWVAGTPRGLNSARITAASMTALFGLYVAVLQMRALGRAYRKHHDALGWTLGEEA